MVFGKEKLADLELDTRARATAAIVELDTLPFDIMITETLRPALTQLAYFAQSRLTVYDVNRLRLAAGLPDTKDTGRITNLDGIVNKSEHQRARAMDVVPMLGKALHWKAPASTWLKLGEVARKYGFEWGGDWKANPAAELGWDCPHWQYVKK